MDYLGEGWLIWMEKKKNGGVVKQKKGQKKTPLKKKKTFLVHQFNFGEKKTNQKATMMNQPTTFMHLCKNLHIYIYVKKLT